MTERDPFERFKDGEAPVHGADVRDYIGRVPPFPVTPPPYMPPLAYEVDGVPVTRAEYEDAQREAMEAADDY